MTALKQPSMLSPTSHSTRWKDGGPALIAVGAAHALLLAGVLLGLHTPAAPVVTLPTLAGVLVAEAPPESPPPPAPQPRPQPQPKTTKPRPAPPAVKAPPTERSITTPETPVEDVPANPSDPTDAPAPQASPAPAAPQAAATSRDDGPPPVAPPLANAGHLNNPAPVYPEKARRRGEQGTVQIALLVLADGSVGEIGLARSSGYPDLDESALKAVARWRFVPASRAGVPIDFRYVLPVNFNLRR